MRSGRPSSSTTRSSGPVGKPSGGDFSGCPGAVSRAGFSGGGTCFGYGAFARCPPGTSMVPSSSCSRCTARQVWKPLECAEMPRIACMDTGRPVKLECVRPAQSVHSQATSMASSNAVWAISSARRSIVAAGTPHTSSARRGEYASSR